MADNLENKGPGQENEQGQDQTLPDRLNGREENEEVGATVEKKRPGKKMKKMKPWQQRRGQGKKIKKICIKQT